MALPRQPGGSRNVGAPTGEPVLVVENLSKIFGSTLALDRVGLDLRPGEIHALVGHNGSGKSTLIKILAGCEVPEAGSRVTVAGQPLAPGSPQAAFLAGCRFVHQALGLIDAFSIADNIALVGGWATRLGTIRSGPARRRTFEALSMLGLDLDPDQPVGELSPAERTGVAVARALQPDERSDTSVLVLDEPTATLPLPEVQTLHRLIGAVADRGVAVLFVSHRLNEVLEISDRITVFRNGRHVSTAPTSESSHTGVVTAMLGYALRQVVAPPGRDVGTVDSAAILAVEGLSSHVLRDISFFLGRGQIVGVAGIEGSGRDVLLPAIFGYVARRGGSVRVRGVAVAAERPQSSLLAGLAYVPADRERLASLPGLSARENITLADLRSLSRSGRVHRQAEREEADGWFERLDVRPRHATEALFESFSGGNRQKLVFARALRCDPAVLLLEEPSQGVDVGAQAMLHREILSFSERGGSVLVSSSDADELARLCHRVLVIRGGRIVADLQQHQVSEPAISQSLFAEGELAR